MDKNKLNGKNVFITVRHGSYDGSQNLSPVGEEQMREVAKKLKEINVDGLPVTIICSTAPRAQQGAKIIAAELNIPEERTIYNECLYRDSYHYCGWDKIVEFITDNMRKDEILLAISHLDLVPAMTRYLSIMFGHKDKVFYEPEYGSGWQVNAKGFDLFP